MNKLFFIPYKNIVKRPVRSGALILLAAVLSLTVFAGALIVKSLRSGFASLESRLGADIMVVPYEATTKQNLENIVLQGNTGYFYMKGEYLDKLSAIPGVGRISPQYYLASVKAGCCSIPVQIIGYDPKTDFSITPWIKRSNGGEVGYLDVVVGNDLNAFVGDTLSFFGVKVKVAGKLDKTGTSYDTEVFTTKETIRTLIDASLNKQLNAYSNINAGDVVSCILIDAADGYAVDDVVNDINIHNKKIRAIRTTNMISGIADSLSGISDVAGTLAVLVWLVAFGIMAVAFSMMTGERKKEFAVLRVLGASRKRLAVIVFTEGTLLALIGSILGVIIGTLVIIPFAGYIESRIALPFLLPDAWVVFLAGVGAIALSVLTGAITVFFSAHKISRLDTGTILRSGE
ncbi:MAG: FtsX-like permease family protein [Lachnospiraceae bacterium]|nr:FtsX-like permease family protein [Lachnospiraceae bacterium]